MRKDNDSLKTCIQYKFYDSIRKATSVETVGIWSDKKEKKLRDECDLSLDELCLVWSSLLYIDEL